MVSRGWIGAALAVVLATAGQAQEWESLFNGKDLTGWEGDTKLWSVEDGAITGKTDGKLPYNKFLLYTGKPLENFELKLKFRMTAGNSGVQYRSKHLKDKGEYVVGGYQADIDATGRYTGILYEERGRGILAERGQKVTIAEGGKKEVTGSTGDPKALLEGVNIKEFHSYTITANGNKLSHVIDGRTMAEVVDNDTKGRAMSGILAFQIHVGPEMVVQFKDIQLKRLPAEGGTNGARVPAPRPQWIWAGAPKDRQKVFLRREFNLTPGLTSARLTASGDNKIVVYLDGEKVLASDNWEEPVGIDLAERLKDKPGKHVLAIEAENSDGPAGVVAKLNLESPGKKGTVMTNGTWQASTEPAEGWKKVGFEGKWQPAKVIAQVGGTMWTSIDAKALDGAGKARAVTSTPSDKLKVKKDYKVELLYSVPKEQQGSWVNLCADGKGRLIVSDQYGGLYRVAPGVDGKETTVEPVPAAIGEAQGLLWAFDSLYVVVNKGGKYESGLYRVTDSDNDDKLDKVEFLKSIPGGAGEHGPHAVLLTPDGKNLVVVCGNQSKLVPFTESRVPQHWGEDHLLPRMPDGRGFMAGVLGPGGTIYQVTPNGKDWSIITTGFRNEFDAGFNAKGDLFTYDADMEWDVNTPWYRPTRVCQVLSGVDYGWRNGAGKWPAHYVDSMGSVVDIGPGSPTGVCFGTGAKFPAKYQNAFFICDWSYGKLYATHLKADGAGYTGELEEFISGMPLPLTDVIVNPVDGNMYFTIGGRRTQSGLYRVKYVGSESTAPAGNPDDGNEAARALRRALEAGHMKPEASLLPLIWSNLDNTDRVIRSAARIALEHQPVDRWADKALAEANPSKATAALVALMRVSASDPAHRKPGDKEPSAELKAKLFEAMGKLQAGWDKATEQARADLLRAYAILCVRYGAPDESTRASLLEAFEPRFPTNQRLVDGDFAAFLVFLQAPGAAKKITSLLTSAPTQEEQMDLARALRMLKTGWTPELRKAQLEWLRKALTYKGGNSFGGFIANIKRDTVATLTADEKEAFKELLTEKPAVVSNQPAAPTRKLVKQYVLEDLAGKLESGLKGGRDWERGRVLFGQTTCFSCHRYGNEGGAQGPDLTGVAGRFSPRDLLESILEPSKTISDQYEAVIIETTDGKLVSGRIVNLNGDTMMVMTNMLDPNDMASIDRKRVESVTSSKVSMMPKGLLDTLETDEILDLMAYMLAKGDKGHSMFKK